MLDLPRQIIIFDTEYTCWEGSKERNWTGPNEYREIVQIGAIRVDVETLKEIDSRVIFIKPKFNPTLSEYFIDLTGITQVQVDKEGVDFKTGLQQFLSWVKGTPMYSFGGDEMQLKENCGFYGLSFPLEKYDFRDARKFFMSHGIPANNYQSGTILQAFGKEPTRRGHDGINDARSILDGLRELKNRRGPITDLADSYQ